jgi:RNA polymerase sigma-70 factor (ECF subfamily)
MILSAQQQPELFGDVYQLYLGRVYRYLRALSASNDDAADLTQIVFVRAMSALPRYKPGGVPFSAWLFKIARNAATDAHRRRRPQVSVEAITDTMNEPEADSPEQALLIRERLLQLRQRLETLDRDKRELLALRFGAGLSMREIAGVLGKREDAVRKQLSRTIASLKENSLD